MLQGWERIEAATTSTTQDDFLHGSVLDNKRKWVKLNKSIVIIGEMMDRDKVFRYAGNMQYLV
jgi:hypothetical protein